MATKILKWGKPTLELALLGEDGLLGTFTTIFTPVQDSFTLTVEEGNKLEAFIEGGERIAVRQDSNKYTFEFQVYLGGDLEKPIPDVDGRILSEYAIRVIPENPTLKGFLMERAAVSVTETFTSKDGHRATYKFEALKPAEGNMLKEYLAPVA
jgi:hypothetical protein